MGLRDKLKTAIRHALGGASPPPATAPPSAPTTSTATSTATSAPPSTATSAPTTSTPTAAAPTQTKSEPIEAPAGAESHDPPQDPSEKDKQEKIEKARTRARKGVLKHIQSRGGSLPMADAHDHSERRYFIAHRGFSDMMEWWLTEGYIRYEEGVVSVTEEGAAYAAAP